MTDTHGNIGNQNAVKDDKDKATSTLICRLKPSEKALFVKAAQHERMKLTQWVMKSLMTSVPESMKNAWKHHD